MQIKPLCTASCITVWTFFWFWDEADVDGAVCIHAIHYFQWEAMQFCIKFGTVKWPAWTPAHSIGPVNVLVVRIVVCMLSDSIYGMETLFDDHQIGRIRHTPFEPKTLYQIKKVMSCGCYARHFPWCSWALEIHCTSWCFGISSLSTELSCLIGLKKWGPSLRWG